MMSVLHKFFRILVDYLNSPAR
ncbi:hypothetical protein EMIT0215P_260058 [Pseudomonas serboccidentalis]